MFNNITKIFLAAALVALVLTSCTDEADVLDNKPIKNKKTTEENIRPYPQYEENDFSESDVIDIVNDFDELIKDTNYLDSDFEITHALLAMETYFNYAIVDKQDDYNLELSYNKQTFSFTTPITEAGKINSDTLRQYYLRFVSFVLDSMNYKYLQFSDLYVSSSNDENITFSLDIGPYISNYYDIRCTKIIRPSGQDFTLPIGVYTDWNLLNYGDYDYVISNYTRIRVEGVQYDIVTKGISDLISPTLGCAYEFHTSVFYNPNYTCNDIIYSGDELKSIINRAMDNCYLAVAEKSQFFAGRTPTLLLPSIYIQYNNSTICKIIHFQELTAAKIGYDAMSVTLNNLFLDPLTISTLLN